jgi:Winged helix DNA-binding domain
MKLTARALNRTMLSRQLLLRRKRLDVAEAVRRIVAVQAQSPPSPYLALWNRVAGLDAADVDAAFTARDVVKASLMRITLHAVHESDYPAFHSAMVAALRASRLNDRRFTSTGMTVADVDAVLPTLLEFADEPRSGTEMRAMLKDRLGVTEDRVWWAFRTMAPLLHAPKGGPWSFGDRPAFLSSGVTAGDPDAAVQHLIIRYLEGFGPASARDFTRFAILPQRITKAAWDGLGDRIVEVEGPDGERLFDVPDATYADENVSPPPRLLGMWDSVLLAYYDRSRVIPQEYRAVVTRRNGDVLPTVLVDGYVAGVWRAVEDGIEVTAFRRLSDETWIALAAEARRLITFLADREPRVYSRYGHWWSHLPNATVRVLR